MTTTTDNLTRYAIDRHHITEGQVVWSITGEPSTVFQVRWEGEPGPGRILAVMLTPADGGLNRTVWLTRTRPHLFTWLTPEQADQPGMDSTTGRCATCDSPGCGATCSNPWAADRA